MDLSILWIVAMVFVLVGLIIASVSLLERKFTRIYNKTKNDTNAQRKKFKDATMNYYQSLDALKIKYKNQGEDRTL